MIVRILTIAYFDAKFVSIILISFAVINNCWVWTAVACSVDSPFFHILCRDIGENKIKNNILAAGFAASYFYFEVGVSSDNLGSCLGKDRRHAAEGCQKGKESFHNDFFLVFIISIFLFLHFSQLCCCFFMLEIGGLFKPFFCCGIVAPQVDIAEVEHGVGMAEIGGSC